MPIIISSMPLRLSAFLFAAALLAGCVAPPQRQAGVLPGSGVTVYAAGDIADCRYRLPHLSGAYETSELVLRHLRQDPQAVVLTLGDNTYPVGTLAEFRDCYEPTWGRFKARTYPSPGNHEYYTAGAPGYYGYFGAAAGPDRRGYYSFRLGGWHVVSLNSELKGEAMQAQLAWLKEDLAQHPMHCTLAFLHHPRFSSGGHSDNPRMEAIWRTLHAAGVDVVLAGHDHHYERFAPLDADGRRDDRRGMRQFVVGTGGAQFSPLRLPQDGTEERNNNTHGVLRLVLKDTGYEWTFLPARHEGYSDEGVGLCH
ncbi:Calcineurin-like phosphoesterase [Noviherbaspirillum humi]|uniref:Calcineurin-like phosphoesterase n=1 Tax=Noviherbaspirillum humi TaxID=1688639 RepID=A0A239E118_9BURK|nr:metallophosphoesterase [Noviherbaspirillum humi]SNS38061.1 Calcineurin-like phosphoesterase [Noviherbaspirillum humi]